MTILCKEICFITLQEIFNYKSKLVLASDMFTYYITRVVLTSSVTVFIFFSRDLGEGLIVRSCGVARHIGSVFRHSGSSRNFPVL